MSKESPDIESLLYEALKRADCQERQAYLEAACGVGTAVRAEVDSLLRAYESGIDVLKAPPDLLSEPADALIEDAGDVIGRYRLLEKIGEGGMAVVYMAEQAHPIRRKVALKVIKLGMDTKQVIARFDAERQALAMMDHPNIAKVLDAGATDTGRPYFVMELVTGVSITEYCDKNSLSTRGRLALFIQVCNAVQHAHQKGIIHRDVKPSNVMVAHHDGKPVPKIIDFGIAKATNQRLTEKTLFTHYAHIIGTPAYMSPEQAELSDLDIDTRSDIYSLGVLLYELLTGTPPFGEEELRKAGYLEMQRIIREQEPLKPSTKLGTLGETLTDIARQRRSTPQLLRKTLRDDLDWIVMKALEKDRTRRYETASALALDVQHHQANEPVFAHAPDMLYRLQKFGHRHRSRIAIAAVVTVLAVGFAVTVVKYWHASRLEWAKGEALPRLVELVEAGDYHTAFPLARQARKIIPQDPVLTNLWPRISKTYSISTTPAGAQVFYREYSDQDGPWHYRGQSPLQDITLANSIYRWKFEKQGYIPHECVTDRSLSVRLCPRDLGREMVWIKAWQNELPGDSQVQSTSVEVPAFWMDKYEVTNEQFQAFINAGGYANADYWEGLIFNKDGRQLTWQQAMAALVDQTGQPGPATWKNGIYPQGQERYPVSGVSWFEAKAYARFSGNSLPTVHHWYHAACLEESTIVLSHSNLAVGGTAVVGSFPGMGHTGLYDMAGNVKEWCFNATDDSSSRRYILGGGYGDQANIVFLRDIRTPWDRNAVNGFRCVKYIGGTDSLAHVLLAPEPQARKTRNYATAQPCSDEEYSFIVRQFQYDWRPLEGKIERADDSAPLWKEETITFNAAYTRERVIAHLFLPKADAAPYQVVVYWPHNGALEKRPFTGLEQQDFTEMILQSGRALMFPVYQGTYERSFGRMLKWGKEPHAVSDWVIHVCQDMCRSIDYLETRHDIDKDRIAYYGVSVGGLWGPMALAIEDRFRAGILVSGGFLAGGYTASTPAIDPLHHAPRVKVPVLMINGKDDHVFPYETAQRPMYQLLGTPESDRKHQVYPGGHGLLSLHSDDVRRDIVDWLDRYLGSVE